MEPLVIAILTFTGLWMIRVFFVSGLLMRTIITGGAGFIGSHLCERFLAEGHEVICVDNLITGALGNVEHLRANPSFEFRRHDVSHHIDIDGPVDNVLHFASPASPVDYL